MYKHSKTKCHDQNDLKLDTVIVLNILLKPVAFIFKRSRSRSQVTGHRVLLGQQVESTFQQRVCMNCMLNVQLIWIAKMCGRATHWKYSSEVVVSYLPLSHVAAQIVDIYCPLLYAASVYFAQPDALKVVHNMNCAHRYMSFLADRTNSCTYATVLCPSVCLLSVTYVL